MAKKKQEAKLKEPVRIRFKQLANGNQSIYLDYYTGDVILWNENKIMSVSSGHLTIKLSIVNRSVFVTDEKPNTARNYHVASLVEIVL